MALSSFTITIITKEDSPFNVIPNAAIEIRERLTNGSSGNLSLIFSDSAGLNPITQVGATTNSLGQLSFFAAAADYNAVYDNNGTPVTIAVDVGVTGGILNERFDRLNPATVADMLNNSGSVEGQAIRTFFYNTNVICDWRLTQSPDANSINLAITADPGWFAVLVPLLGIMLTPEMVGARGDGVSEDHAEVQICLDYFENNKFFGEVRANKKYLVGDTISGRSFASLLGFGEFKAKDGLNKTIIDIYAASPNRKIEGTTYRDFKIDGNKANQTTTDDLLGAGFALRCDVINPFANGDQVDHVGEIENIVVENITSNNCKVNNFYFGRNTFVTQSYKFTGLKGKGAVNGIFLDDFCEYIEFFGINMQQNEFGVLDNGSSNISFIGGTSANNTEAGIYLKTTGRNTSKKIITGMHLNHNKRGVWVGVGVGTIGEVIDQIIITNNHLLANTSQGVVASAGSRGIIKGNIFSGNSESGAGLFDDIFLANACRQWDIDNTHRNSTGNVRHAVFYENPAPAGVDSHAYHTIDGTFEDYTDPIGYLPFGDPSSILLNANTNFIQGVFEYWNTAGLAPSSTAANSNASVDTQKIPFGTICVNNADNTGAERYRAVKAPSSASGSGVKSLTVIFERVAVFV